MLTAWCNAEGEAGNRKSSGNQTGMRHSGARDSSSGPGDVRQNPARLLRRYRVDVLLPRFQPSSQMHDSREAEFRKLRQRAGGTAAGDAVQHGGFVLVQLLELFREVRARLRNRGKLDAFAGGRIPELPDPIEPVCFQAARERVRTVDIQAISLDACSLQFNPTARSQIV